VLFSTLRGKDFSPPAGEGRPSGKRTFLPGGGRTPFGELLSVTAQKVAKEAAQEGGFLQSRPPLMYLPRFVLKSLHLHGVPCYDRENTNFKSAYVYIRCDAVAADYFSFALFKKLAKRFRPPGRGNVLLFLCGEITPFEGTEPPSAGEGRPSGSYFLCGTESSQRSRIRGGLFQSRPPLMNLPPLWEVSAST
jgi:hypothetical protein